MPGSFLVVLSTYPSLTQAKQISRLLVERRLAACVNILGPIQSFFWWKGKVDRAREYLLVIKTKTNRFRSLQTVIEKRHPYSVPEIIALPIRKGNTPYLNWLRASIR